MHDEDEDFEKGGYFLQELDEIDQDLKKVGDQEAVSSPKSANHAMGLEAHDLIDEGVDEGVEELKREDFGNTEEEQRKGLWRSIFGYFRGPRKGSIK